MTKRQEFPKSVKVARLKHATIDGITKCEQCGVLVKPGEFAFDHNDPDKLTGKPTFDNCRCLCLSCHSAKTTADVERIARAVRQEAAHLLGKQQPAKPIQSAGFAKKPKRTPRPSLPPRQLYAATGGTR